MKTFGSINGKNYAINEAGGQVWRVNSWLNRNDWKKATEKEAKRIQQEYQEFIKSDREDAGYVDWLMMENDDLV